MSVRAYFPDHGVKWIRLSTVAGTGVLGFSGDGDSAVREYREGIVREAVIPGS